MTFNVDLTITAPGGPFQCQGTISSAESGTNPAAAMAEWLGSIDPEELQRFALDAQSFHEGSYTAVVLDILRRWASGDQS